MNLDNLKRKTCLVILGYAGAGKDTVANMIFDTINSPRPRSLRFSAPLKDLCEGVFGWSSVSLGDWAYKEEKFDQPLKRMDGSNIWNRREALQYLGTQVFRQMDPEVWVKAALRAANGQASMFDCSGFICTDCRFPNELEALKKHFGSVKVVRMVKHGGATTALQADGTPHESERYIATFPVDAQYTIEAGDFDGLRAVANRLATWFPTDAPKEAK